MRAASYWKAQMRKLARHNDNVVSKFSAFGTFIHRNDPAHIERMVLHDTVEFLEPKRCLFGSNFPIEKLWTSYAIPRCRLSRRGSPALSADGAEGHLPRHRQAGLPPLEQPLQTSF
jgi:hypothetical protein